MKSYFEIQVPTVSLPATRGFAPGPASLDPHERPKGRLPGPAGVAVQEGAKRRLFEETIGGGPIVLELDGKTLWWRIAPPAYAHREHYLPSASGRWARSGDEIAICDEAGKSTFFSLKQANRMSGRALHTSALAGRHGLRAEWKRVPRPLPACAPPIWYGLAVENDAGPSTGKRAARAVVLSSDKWFTFLMPEPVASGGGPSGRRPSCCSRAIWIAATSSPALGPAWTTSFL